MKTAQVLATTGDAPDVEIVSAVLGGDVRRFAVLGDDTEAEDAVQAAWVAAYRHLGTFRGDAAFKTWVTRIAVHEASARRKKRARLAAVPVEEITVPESSSPERDAFRDQLARLLERELDALPEGMRSVLVLRVVLELDTAETAAALEISDEAVRVRLHRARAALARQLATLVAQGAPQVWRFDGARCARIVDRVMAEILPAQE